MISLNENYKIKVAEELTKLSIEHQLIREHSDVKETALAICKFYQTLIENLDTDLNK